MPSYRIGFGSDFNLNDAKVGIGTTLGRTKLDVVGTIKADFDISGVTTFTSYGGFASQKQSVSTASTIGFSTTGIGTAVSVNEKETGFISLVGEFNTVSEDIVVDDGKVLDVSTIRNIGVTTLGTQSVYVPNNTTVSVGTLEHVSIGTHFSVPNSGISSRPQDPKEGMVRFNDDLNTLEFYNGVEWRQFTVTGASGRGIFSGSSQGVNSAIEFVNISSLGNSQDFGDSSPTHPLHDRATTASSSTRGLFVGGRIRTPTLVNTNTIGYITIASSGNTLDFGDLTIARRMMIGVSSSSRGVFGGGYNPVQNTIDYVQIATLGNALDFGDLPSANQAIGGCSSPTRGVWAGGYIPSREKMISFVTISSTGNAINFGDLTQARAFLSGCSNSTRGIFGGGESPSQLNSIEYITIASTGNATTFGELTLARNGLYSCSSQTRGLFGGGGNPTGVNIIDYVNISTFGNALDFGDLSNCVGRFIISLSDSHGGLGGF